MLYILTYHSCRIHSIDSKYDLFVDIQFAKYFDKHIFKYELEKFEQNICFYGYVQINKTCFIFDDCYKPLSIASTYNILNKQFIQYKRSQISENILT